jgi:hypothetical protein
MYYGADWDVMEGFCNGGENEDNKHLGANFLRIFHEALTNLSYNKEQE